MKRLTSSLNTNTNKEKEYFMCDKRLAVQRVMKASMLNNISTILEISDNKVLQSMQQYMLGWVFSSDVLTSCMKGSSFQYKVTDTTYSIGTGQLYRSSDWYNPEEVEEVEVKVPSNFLVSLFIEFDSRCIAQLLYKETKGHSVLLPEHITQKSDFGKLFSEAFYISLKDLDWDLLSYFENITDDLEDEVRGNVSYDNAGVIDTNYKLKDLKLKSTGRIIGIEVLFELEMEWHSWSAE